METIKTILWRLKDCLETPLFTLGEAQITLLSVLYFLLLLILLVFISGKSLVNRVLARRGVDLGVREATGARSTTVLTNDNLEHHRFFQV